MKKCSLLLPLVCFLFACSADKKDMPRLELMTILLNGGDTDYSQKLKEILPLSPDDYIDVSFLLDGNGADLKTFIVKNEYDNIKVTFVDPDQISTVLSDIPQGILTYIDGVKSTRITVKLTVESAKEEELRIGFYLNSKAPNGEGAVYYLDLQTVADPRVADKE